MRTVTLTSMPSRRSWSTCCLEESHARPQFSRVSFGQSAGRTAVNEQLPLAWVLAWEVLFPTGIFAVFAAVDPDICSWEQVQHTGGGPRLLDCRRHG
jgi:hypothetical protein